MPVGERLEWAQRFVIHTASGGKEPLVQAAGVSFPVWRPARALGFAGGVVAEACTNARASYVAAAYHKRGSDDGFFLSESNSSTCAQREPTAHVYRTFRVHGATIEVRVYCTKCRVVRRGPRADWFVHVREPRGSARRPTVIRMHA